MDAGSDDDDVPQLSADTLAVLQEFLSEKKKEEEEAAEGIEPAKMPGEDWVCMTI